MVEGEAYCGEKGQPEAGRTGRVQSERDGEQGHETRDGEGNLGA